MLKTNKTQKTHTNVVNISFDDSKGVNLKNKSSRNSSIRVQPVQSASNIKKKYGFNNKSSIQKE